MTKYSVKQVSKLAGVSVRTLHYYDKIGLLKPSVRTEKNYRYYNRERLLKLQQILFYKELDFSLKEIIEILNDPDFDLLSALEFQKKEIAKRSANLKKLIQTLEKTIVELKTGKMMTENEIYEGFTPEETSTMRKEVKEKWGEDELLNSEERIRKLGKKGWEEKKQEAEQINKELVSVMQKGVETKETQEVVAKHFRYIETFYEVSKERYLGLSQLYVEDERFKAYYEKYKTGLAQFLSDAMVVFCNNNLKVKG